MTKSKLNIEIMKLEEYLGYPTNSELGLQINQLIDTFKADTLKELQPELTLEQVQDLNSSLDSHSQEQAYHESAGYHKMYNKLVNFFQHDVWLCPNCHESDYSIAESVTTLMHTESNVVNSVTTHSDSNRTIELRKCNRCKEVTYVTVKQYEKTIYRQRTETKRSAQ